MRTWPALVVRFPPTEAAGGDVAIGDLVAAELDGLDVVAIAEQAEDEWQVYFREPSARREAARQLEARLGRSGLTVRDIEVPDGDWARRTQDALGAIHVGALTIAPPWDGAATARAEGTIIIEPAMGFGSGHHATTRLCLAALQRIDLRGRQVLDIGTGSGVLALAAARLGACEVLGVDLDEDALDNARTNAALNGSPAAVTFQRADFRDGARAAADVVVANLTGGMLLAGVADLLRSVRRPGVLILSGITQGEAEDVAHAFRAHARQDWDAAEDGWCAFTFSL